MLHAPSFDRLTFNDTIQVSMLAIIFLLEVPSLIYIGVEILLPGWDLGTSALVLYLVVLVVSIVVSQLNCVRGVTH